VTDGASFAEQPDATRVRLGSGAEETPVWRPNGDGASSPWWSDGRNDPWRDPSTPTEIVMPSPPPASPPPPIEPVQPAGAGLPRGRVLMAVLVTALLVGLAAGVLGGALGYTLASRDRTGTVLGGSPDAAPAALTQRPPESLAGVAERVLPSVVTIRAGGSRGGTNLGSGFVISADGHVLTNDHVVGEVSTPPLVTFHDGSSSPAEVVGRDPESDLAVIRAEQLTVPPVQLGDSAAVAVGDPVLAFGSPLALANTVTAGIVSAVDRTIQAGEPEDQVRYYAAIQTDAAVNQGNSGGPLVDAAGRVIGVNSVIKSLAETEDEAANIGLAFAIPINQAKRIAQEIIDTGQARRTVIGADFDRSGRIAGGGVRLATVTPDGPADQAGMRVGDVVLRFGGQQLIEPADLIALIRKNAPGAVVTVDYRRGSEEHSVAVTLVADG
jgi:putative serine protease PepD